MSALNDIQESIYQALTGDAALAAKITGVFDHVPQGQEFPYIAFGTRTEKRLDAMGNFGKDCTFELKIWSQYAGYKQVEEILDAINTVLDYQTLIVENWTSVFIRFENAVSLDDPDGKTKQLSARYRVVVMP